LGKWLVCGMRFAHEVGGLVVASLMLQICV